MIDERVYGEPIPDDDFWDRHVYKAAGVRLKSPIERGVERFVYVYVYDFGDDWRHNIFIESLGDGEANVEYPAFVDGERRCPPEDVGGAPGLMQFLEAALDPLHEEHNNVVTWYGKPFDPVDIDERWVRPRLATWPPAAAVRSRGIAAQRRQIRPDLRLRPAWTIDSGLWNAVRHLAGSRLFHEVSRAAAGRVVALRGRRTSWGGGRDRSSRIVWGNPRADCVRNGVRAWPRRCPPPRTTGVRPTCVAFGPNTTDYPTASRVTRPDVPTASHRAADGQAVQAETLHTVTMEGIDSANFDAAVSAQRCRLPARLGRALHELARPAHRKPSATCIERSPYRHPGITF